MNTMTNIQRCALVALLAASVTAAADIKDPIIHEGHIHYDQDVWEALPPDKAVQMLRAENIHRALVSATPGEGDE